MKKLIYSSLFAVLLLCLWQNQAKAQTDDDKIYSFVSLETPPTYPGGINEFYKFLGSNIKYPTAAVKENVQGNVFLSFTVEKDGSLNDIKVDHKLGSGTDEEAIRVLKMSKKWNPGKLDGKSVRVKYNIPVKFAIAGVKPKPKTAQPIAGSTGPVDENTIYSFVSMDHPPTYPGGILKLYSFLAEHIKYPATAVANKVQGNVFISFVVEKDGSLANFKVDHKLGSGTDEEAIRVLKLTKRWNPGMLNGKPARVNYSIPVKFTLEK